MAIVEMIVELENPLGLAEISNIKGEEEKRRVWSYNDAGWPVRMERIEGCPNKARVYTNDGLPEIQRRVRDYQSD